MVVSPALLVLFELLSEPEQLIKKKTRIQQTGIIIFVVLPVIFSSNQACDSCSNDRNLLFERKYMPVLQQVVKIKLARHLVPAAKRLQPARRNIEVMAMEMERVAWEQLLFKGFRSPFTGGPSGRRRADAGPSVTYYHCALKTTPNVRGGASVTYCGAFGSGSTPRLVLIGLLSMFFIYALTLNLPSDDVQFR